MEVGCSEVLLVAAEPFDLVSLRPEFEIPAQLNADAQGVVPGDGSDIRRVTDLRHVIAEGNAGSESVCILVREPEEENDHVSGHSVV